MDKLLASQNAPRGIKAQDVPLFVSFGFDDNERSGFTAEKGSEGMKWAVDAFTKRKNPDGSACTCGFYMTTAGITSGQSHENVALVRKSWKYAFDKGCEIGCHTHSHSDGSNFTVEEWIFEMEKCLDKLTKPYVEGDESENTGAGIPKSEIVSFRTPFLAYNANTLKAVEKKGFLYDCSLEEGHQEDQDGTNFFFPYTLDEGSPGNKYSHSENPEKLIGKHPGIWELPGYALIVPPDELCENYGVKKGLRKKLKETRDYFDIEDGKLTGFDYNLWAEFQMSPEEVLATLKYTLDLRLKGNRAPLLIGAHSAIYALDYESDPEVKISVPLRKKAIEDFLDYALTKPEVQIVAPVKIIDWIKGN